MDCSSSIASSMNCLWCKNTGTCNCVHDHHTGYDSSTSECCTYLQIDLLKTCWVFWSEVAACWVYHGWTSKAVCIFGLAHRVCCDKSPLGIALILCRGRVLRSWKRTLIFSRTLLWSIIFVFVFIVPLFVGFTFHTRQASLDLVQPSVEFRKSATGTAVRRLRLRLWKKIRKWTSIGIVLIHRVLAWIVYGGISIHRQL